MAKIYVGDLTERLGVTADTITNYIRTGQLKGFKEGKFWYVESMEEVERFERDGLNRKEYLKAMKRRREEIKEKKKLPKTPKEFRPKEPRPDLSLLTKEEYTAKDLKGILHLTEYPINKRLSTGIIEATLIGNKYKIKKQAIIDYVKKYFPEPEPTPEPVELFTAPEEPEAPEMPDYFIECKSRRVQSLFQPSLHEDLKAWADAEHDSVNNLIVKILTNAVAEHKKATEPTLLEQMAKREGKTIPEFLLDMLNSHSTKNPPLQEQ